MARSFNIGQDAANVFLIPSDGSAPLTFTTVGGDLISFNAKPKKNVVTRNSISQGGLELRQVEHVAYSGTMMIGRVNADFDKIDQLAQQNYLAGNDEVKYTITLAIINRDGTQSVTDVSFTNCSLYCEDLGNFEMGVDVKMTWQFQGDTYITED